MKRFFTFLMLAAPFFLSAQQNALPDSSWKKEYRKTADKLNDLVHTKLDVKFDFQKSYLLGKAWITLQPHFYAQDSLTLDAKGMDIKEIALMKGNVKAPLKYSYDGEQAKIGLGKKYIAGEKYTIYVDYISKPDEYKARGSAAITDAKGLYFINPRGEEKDKPTQIWTQGETEANSVWFPTIDKPNQKSTEEIFMTVPSKYVTLSNGKLISQKTNSDGTRTDYWKQDLPHAPYLFFMGVGDYAIVKDNYKGKEVSYYVEKPYAGVARRIFGETPAMIAFYEDLTGVPYPWAKYSQIVGRDYVSGAMENTTATLNQESAYQNDRQLSEGNGWEETIAHELFHHWFGDLVTAESWSNLTVNESMADYSETLWNEFRHGKDAGDAKIEADRASYLSNPDNANKNLVRFYYADKEDMFDNVSYPKGGAILHMLRKYLGDDAFKKGLNKYLTDNKFKSAEAQNLRLAMEDVSGKDLNWFFNDWYYNNGNPKLQINYTYGNNIATVIVNQTQTNSHLFTLPVNIDVYVGTNRVTYPVWVKNASDTFSFKTNSKASFINFDADKILLAEKEDNHDAEGFKNMWSNAKNYLDRKEALDYFSKQHMPELAWGLDDKFAGLREMTLDYLSEEQAIARNNIAKIEKLAESDLSGKVKAAAVSILTQQKDKKYIDLFTRLTKDSSYNVAGRALGGLFNLAPQKAFELAKELSSDAKDDLGFIVMQALLASANEADFKNVIEIYSSYPAKQEKLDLTEKLGIYLGKVKDEEVKEGIGKILSYKKSIPSQYRSMTDETFKETFDKLIAQLKLQGRTQVADYINSLTL